MKTRSTLTTLFVVLAATSCRSDEVCDDGVDNDRDGMVDCEDADCTELCDSGEGDTDTDSDSDADSDTDTDCESGEVSEHQGIPMAYVCAGSFTMGSPEDEVGRRDEDVQYDEDQHEVTLSRDQLVGVYEVTQGEFFTFMSYQPSTHGDCSRCPVETVSWHEAAAFANAVTAETNQESGVDLGLCYECVGEAQAVRCESSSAFESAYHCDGYRLPTEAEWESAARAGGTEAYSWGANLLLRDDHDNCETDVVLDDKSVLAEHALYCGSGVKAALEVGQFEANAWGLYDVHGNVYEWCHDGHAEYDGDTEDAVGPEDAEYRNVRGGSWNSWPGSLRSAYRGRSAPDNTNDHKGFRLARTAPAE